MTFSIVARSADGASWGVAVASRFLAVGNTVPAAVAGIGAVATQANANTSYKGIALGLLAEGAGAGVVLQRLLEEDVDRDHRQVGIVDSAGAAVTHTGSACFDWAGGVTRDAGASTGQGGYAIQGNILTGPAVVEEMERAFLGTDPERPLADRLLAALVAGEAAGGDRRGRQAAAMLVVRDGAGYGGHDDVAVDLRVDDHREPIPELARLLELNDLFGTATTEADKVEVTPELDVEITALVRALGHDDLWDWVGTENYEMRVAPSGSWIDRRVLAILRATKENP